jgi:hypothetical protein
MTLTKITEHATRRVKRSAAPDAVRFCQRRDEHPHPGRRCVDPA